MRVDHPRAPGRRRRGAAPRISTTSAGRCGSGWAPARAASACTAQPDPPLGWSASITGPRTPRCSSFLEERWKGVHPILHGDQVRQAGSTTGSSRACWRAAPPRMTTPRSRYDTIVIGAGLAGLTAALATGRTRDSACGLAKGVGATHLLQATIDVLGYFDRPVAKARGGAARLHGRESRASVPAPSSPGDRVQASTGSRLVCRRPATRAASTRTSFVPTAVGAAKPSQRLSRRRWQQATFAPGRPLRLRRARGLKDFYPAYLADNLAHASARRPSRSLPCDRGVAAARGQCRTGVAPALQALLEEPSVRDALVRELTPKLERDDRVGFPAVLGLARAGEVWRELEARLGAARVRSCDPRRPRCRVPPVQRDEPCAARGGWPGARRRAGCRGRDQRWPGRSRHHPADGAGDDLPRRLVRARDGRVCVRWASRSTPTARCRKASSASRSSTRRSRAEPRFLPDYFAEHPLNRVGCRSR